MKVPTLEITITADPSRFVASMTAVSHYERGRRAPGLTRWLLANDPDLIRPDLDSETT